jgi:hypothetical protein
MKERRSAWRSEGVLGAWTQVEIELFRKYEGQLGRPLSQGRKDLDVFCKVITTRSRVQVNAGCKIRGPQ